MTKFDKAKQRLKSRPLDYTYSEARTLLLRMGFSEETRGKTSGSRVDFYRESDGKVIMLHKPHPGNIMKPGAVRFLADFLEDIGEL